MLDAVHTPRLVIAGTHSGSGKTTVAAGLVAAFRRRRKTVQTFKVGPDYVDAAYLARVSGRPCRNLDPWMLGEGAIRQILAQGCFGADLAVVEGIQGLFDGRDGADGSTADVARMIGALVLLVVDARGMSHSAAAVVLGFKQLDPRVRFAGVVLNNVLSDDHRRLAEDAIWSRAKLPVLGALPPVKGIAIPDSDQGLLAVRENPAWPQVEDRLAEVIAGSVDLDMLGTLAARAELLPLVPRKVFAGKARTARPVRIAVAYDDAFNFYYPENLELIADCGGEVAPFSPLLDGELPAGSEGLYLGGGFPGGFAARLSQNRSMAAALRAAHQHGVPIYAEGAGLSYLAQTLRTADGQRHAMVGLLPCDVEVGTTSRQVGPRQVLTVEDTVLAARGQFFRGHEYHWSRVVRANGAPPPVYRLTNPAGEVIGFEGFAAPNLQASLVQLHFGQNPVLVEHFLQRCEQASRVRDAIQVP
jgi:cobyrinic acid a,c-diamide synthase